MHIAAVPIASDFTVVIAAGCKDDADNQRSQNIDARRYDSVIHSVSNYEFFVPCFKASAPWYQIFDSGSWFPTLPPAPPFSSSSFPIPEEHPRCRKSKCRSDRSKAVRRTLR